MITACIVAFITGVILAIIDVKLNGSKHSLLTVVAGLLLYVPPVMLFIMLMIYLIMNFP